MKKDIPRRTPPKIRHDHPQGGAARPQAAAGERLHKILARSGICSRRKAEELIREGKVAVDGKVVTGMGLKADPLVNAITVNGKPLHAAHEAVYLLLNKPKGYVTTLHDPQGRPVVTELLGEIPVRVFPVGRLDLDTEGALILTNDGEFADRILHPRNEIRRTYLARVTGHPPPQKLAQLERGIELDGRLTWPARVRVLGRRGACTDVEIVIHEGRKRQVRRMFAAIGHPVETLRRVAYGGLRLGSLRPGAWRRLSERDLLKIFHR